MMLRAALVFALLVAARSSDPQPCDDTYSKNEATGPINTKDKCTSACQTAEGKNIGDFKTNNVNNTDYFKCSCCSGSCTSYIDLCEDPQFADGAFSVRGAIPFGLAGAVLATLYGMQ